MTIIWCIKHETDFGPFFSTKDKAISYVKREVFDDEEAAIRLEDAIAGNDPYCNIIEVCLDDEDTIFDG